MFNLSASFIVGFELQAPSTTAAQTLAWVAAGPGAKAGKIHHSPSTSTPLAFELLTPEK